MIKIDTESHAVLGGAILKGDLPLHRYEAIADTGAAICCTSDKEMEKMGLKKSTVLKSNLKLYAADKRQLDIVGCVPVNISTKQEDEVITIKEILYFVNGLDKTFISKDALVALGAVPQKFPRVSAMRPAVVANLNTANGHTNEDEDFSIDECTCPQRCEAPDPPKLSNPVETYTVDELKNILLEHYNMSTSASTSDARSTPGVPC